VALGVSPLVRQRHAEVLLIRMARLTAHVDSSEGTNHTGEPLSGLLASANPRLSTQ
jgi:hypothetical protein